MPRARRAPGRRPRVPNTPKHRLAKIKDAAFDMEEPLADAGRFLHALRLIGHGMAADNDDTGEPIAAIAGAAQERLDALKASWEKILKAMRG